MIWSIIHLFAICISLVRSLLRSFALFFNQVVCFIVFLFCTLSDVSFNILIRLTNLVLLPRSDRASLPLRVSVYDATLMTPRYLFLRLFFWAPDLAVSALSTYNIQNGARHFLGTCSFFRFPHLSKWSHPSIHSSQPPGGHSWLLPLPSHPSITNRFHLLNNLFILLEWIFFK